MGNLPDEQQFYRVEKTDDSGECLNCKQACTMWTIVFDEGGEPTEIGQSWGDREMADDICDLMNMAYDAGLESNTTSAAEEVAGAKEAERSTPPYTADNGDSKSVAAVGRSSACAHEGFYYCKKCGMDLTPEIGEQHGRYNDSPGAARG